MLPDYGLPPDTVFDEVDQFLANDPNLVSLGVHDGQPYYTTQRVLGEERRMLDALREMSRRPGNTLSKEDVNRQLSKSPSLSEEQVKFVRHLTQKNSAFRIGLGLAGTGKTSRAVKACVEAWQRRGYRVLVAAPTGQAARVLGDELGLQGETLIKFLGDFKLPWTAALKHHGWQFLRAARGRRTWRFRQPKAVKITSKTIVLIDESGMLSTPHMRKLAELVEKGKGTLCLIGDPAQLPAVETTSPLQSLARRFGAVTLKDIRRQKQLWARRAAKLFAAGRVGPALAAFAKKNRITVRDDLDETVRQACLDWTAEGLLTPHRVLVLANSNDLTHTANQICQEHRLRAGVLQADRSIRITDEQDDAAFESRLHVHDRVLFTKNSRGRKGYGVDNGSLGTVTAISPNPFVPEITVALDDGSHVRINVNKYRHIRLGYAVTTYRAQGASIAKVHAIVGGSLQSLPSSYVQATRGVEDTHLYTTNDLLNASLEKVARSPLAKQMSKRPDLRLASDLLEEAPLTLRPRKPRIRKVPPPRTPLRDSQSQPTPTAPSPTQERPSGESPRTKPPKRSAQPTRPVPTKSAPRRRRTRIAAATPPRPANTRRKLAAMAGDPIQRVSIPGTSPGTAADGYQRLRLPAGRRRVASGLLLQASCVDGGSNEHRNRLPPPPAHAMPYASDCIRVQRIAPVPSRPMTLADASRDGSFRLEGTGCADHVQVVCAPGEQWIVSVDGPLGLVSPQDDIPGAVRLYGKPQVLREFTRLDDIQTQLQQYALTTTLLHSLFACLRRETSWLLPHSSDPAGVTQQHLQRFCHMLFEDQRAHDFFDWFHVEHQPEAELGPGAFLDAQMQSAPLRPPQQMLLDLGRAIATHQPWQPHYQRCIEALRPHTSAPASQQNLEQSVRQLDRLVGDLFQYIAQQKLPIERQRDIMSTLYGCLSLPVPAHARLHDALADTFRLTEQAMDAFPPARGLWKYATASFRGLEADKAQLHQALRSILSR